MKNLSLYAAALCYFYKLSNCRKRKINFISLFGWACYLKISSFLFSLLHFYFIITTVNNRVARLKSENSAMKIEHFVAELVFAFPISLCVNMIYFLSLAALSHTHAQYAVIMLQFYFSASFLFFLAKGKFPSEFLFAFPALCATNSKSKLKIEETFPRKIVSRGARRWSGIFLVSTHADGAFPSNVFSRAQRFRPSLQFKTARWSNWTASHRISSRVSLSIKRRNINMFSRFDVLGWCSSRSILIEQCSSLWNTTKSSQADHV